MNESSALSPIADYAAQWPVSADRLVLRLLEPGSSPQLEQGSSLASYRRPQPVTMPDRFIDPARPRPGWSPSCSEPLVSIVVRSLGRSCLADALNSLVAQSYRQIEVVVDATGGRHPPLPANIVADERFHILSAGRPLKRPAAEISASTQPLVNTLVFWGCGWESSH
jgi:hypothetical protein